MRNYGYLYLKDDDAQRVVRLWRLNLYRTDVSATPGEWGATPGPEHARAEIARERGSQVQRLASGSRPPGRVRIPGRQGGRKTEKLTLTELARISEFQFFTQSGPMPAGRGGVRC